jgi:hypothetical protein
MYVHYDTATRNPNPIISLHKSSHTYNLAIPYSHVPQTSLADAIIPSVYLASVTRYFFPCSSQVKLN